MSLGDAFENGCQLLPLQVTYLADSLQLRNLEFAALVKAGRSQGVLACNLLQTNEIPTGNAGF